MKSTARILSLLLCLALLVTSLVACGSAQMSQGYKDLYVHVFDTIGLDKAIELPSPDQNVEVFAFIEDVKLEDGSTERGFYLAAQAGNQTNAYRVDIKLGTENASAGSSVEMIYRILQFQGNQAVTVAKAQTFIEASHYTGDGTIHFDTLTGIDPTGEFNSSVTATALMNAALGGLDEYLQKNLGHTASALGFTSLAERYTYHEDKTNEGSTDDDLGGPFSMARLSYSLRMLLLGMAMIFAVLSLLWMVIAIFKKAFNTEVKKNKKKQTETPPTEPAPVPTPAPVEDDGAVISAITAAIAAMIEADEALHSEFASGFRVVSFQKKSGKNAWNR